MHFSASTIAAAALGFSAYANAHIIMTKPAPYSPDTLNNSPLSPDGSDFPCKLRDGAFNVDTDNEMELGSSQGLEFKGMAVHGGGSCQVSIAYTRNPDKDTKFKVIKSFEGGCPDRTATGNIQGNGPNSPLPDKYNFTIPADLQSGEATIAWTWFNKVGNREMYMNCAPVTLKGGNSKRDESLNKRDAFDSLPDMFVANLGNGCNTADSTDLKFPDPGNDVEKKGDDQSLAPPTGSCQSGSGSSDSSSDSSSSSSSSEQASSTSASNSGGVFVPQSAPTSSSASSSAAAASSTAANSVTPVVTLATSTRAAASSVAPSATGSAGNANGTTNGTCSKEQAGQTLCSADGKQIGTCNVDGTVVFGDVADGTVCEKGFQVAARNVRFSRSHGVHRRHGHSHHF